MKKRLLCVLILGCIALLIGCPPVEPIPPEEKPETPDSEPKISVSIEGENFLTLNRSITFQAKLDQDSTSKESTITWESTNSNVASVNSSTGVITGENVGSSTIKAIVKQGSSVVATAEKTLLVYDVPTPPSEIAFGETFILEVPDSLIELKCSISEDSSVGEISIEKDSQNRTTLTGTNIQGDVNVTVIGPGGGSWEFSLTVTEFKPLIVTYQNSGEVTLATSEHQGLKVDWGDGQGFIAYEAGKEVSHTYPEDKKHTITIQPLDSNTSEITGIRLRQITDVIQWGDITYINPKYMFAYSSIAEFTATDSPTLKGSAERMFTGATNFNGDIGGWDTSQVTSMSDIFSYATNFNVDISKWDTSQVTSMDWMFYEATSFNQDIGGWDTDQVTSMKGIFYGATSFNGDISDWDTSQVTSMSFMFSSATNFNGDISNWDTGQVTSMDWMFAYATNFNGDISNWDTSQVTSMSFMFFSATNFNGDISNWDTSQVTDMYGMFAGASNFNQDMSTWTNWNLSSTTTYSMFAGATHMQDKTKHPQGCNHTVCLKSPYN